MTPGFIVILIWGFVALWAFARLQPHTAALTVLLVGFMFLPIPRQAVQVIPWEKREAIGLALLLGALIFDTKTVFRFRLAWVDLPVLCWLVSAPISSLVNNHGLYDAGSSLMHRALLWGAPYFVGAMYLRSRQALLDCLWAVFLGGVAYVPLWLLEVRLSPQFHYWVYGVQQSLFSQTKRGGGFRPMVFMDHGLQASLFMTTAMVAGVGLWWLLRVRRVRGFSMGSLVAAIAVAWALSKSSGAILLGVVGLLTLALPTARWLTLVIMVAVPSYLAMRMFGDGVIEQSLVDAAGMISAERAESLQFRYTNEAALLDRFWRNPWFGSSPWGFNTMVIGESGLARSHAVPDSLWIYGVTLNGLFGVAGLVGSLWCPAARGLGIGSRWRGRIAPEAFLCGVIVMLYLLDSLVNGFKTPIYVLIAGGLSRVSPLREVATRQSRAGVSSRRLLRPRGRIADLPASLLRSRDGT